VNITFRNESGNIRCRKENKRKSMVFDEGNIESMVTVELDI
jgi:hypothetical protein